MNQAFKVMLTQAVLMGSSAAGAAGVLATSQPVGPTSFCQKYRCVLLNQSGREWEYRLNVAGSQTLVVTRESSDPGSRITALSLHSANEEVNGDLDRATFRDVQTLALGFVSHSGRLDSCYALDGGNVRVLADAPDDRSRRIYCDWDPAYTHFTIEADRNYLTRTTPAAITLTSGPTKLNQWFFRTCTSGPQVTAFLPVGKAARCDLIIQSKGEQSAVVRAEFQYELEYVQSGQYVKTLLPDKEVWLPGKAPGPLDPILSQNGRTVTASVSLAVRNVPGRRVTSINTIARLTFANGAVKTAYEPLPVR